MCIIDCEQHGAYMSNLKMYREKVQISQAALAEIIGVLKVPSVTGNGSSLPDLKACRLVKTLNKLGAKVKLDDVFPPERSAA
jgi:putative transcriptional regulator